MQVPVNEQKSVSDISVKLFDKDDFTKDDPLGDCRIPKSVIKRAADTRIRNGNRIQGILILLISYGQLIIMLSLGHILKQT